MRPFIVIEAQLQVLDMVASVCVSWDVDNGLCSLVFERVALSLESPQETSINLILPEASETVFIVFGLTLVDDAEECGYVDNLPVLSIRPCRIRGECHTRHDTYQSPEPL
jgi:hypothetical protein